jgi:hypothetical protein
LAPTSQPCDGFEGSNAISNRVSLTGTSTLFQILSFEAANEEAGDANAAIDAAPIPFVGVVVQKK